jgi:very-short-patch-repair endonuclease
MERVSGRLCSLDDVRRIFSRMGGDPVAAALAIAAAQLGVISRPQLLAVGFSSVRVDAWLRQGRLHRLFHGIYLLGHPVAPEGARQLGALLAAGPGAALRCATAAAWWGIVDDVPAQIQVLTTGPHRGERRGIDIQRGDAADRRDITERRGLLVTTLARTLIDLAAAHHPELERALSNAHAERLITPESLIRELDRLAGMPGAPELRALAGQEKSGYTRSENERRLRALCRRAGLPQPRTNVTLHGWEVDFLWPASGLVVEVDAFSTHGHRAQYHRDRRKQNALVAAGHPFLRYTGHALHHEPLAVIAALSRMIGAPPAEGRATR